MNKLIDAASLFFAHRKGLLPLIGLVLIIINMILAIFLPYDAFLVKSNLLMHLGLIIALFGLMLSWAL